MPRLRTAKSDLKLRPIYHQKTERVEAHILVCFLALAQWRVLEQWMHRKGLGTPFDCAQGTRCARKLVAEIGTIKSMDIHLPVKRGEVITALSVRPVARPARHVAELLQRLGLSLPTRNRILPPASAAAEEPAAEPAPEATTASPAKMECRKTARVARQPASMQNAPPRTAELGLSSARARATSTRCSRA